MNPNLIVLVLISNNNTALQYKVTTEHNTHKAAE